MMANQPYYLTSGHNYAAAIALPVLATVAVGLRFWMRIWHKQGTKMDDWILIPATVRDECVQNKSRLILICFCSFLQPEWVLSWPLVTTSRTTFLIILIFSEASRSKRLHALQNLPLRVSVKAQMGWIFITIPSSSSWLKRYTIRAWLLNSQIQRADSLVAWMGFSCASTLCIRMY